MTGSLVLVVAAGGGCPEVEPGSNCDPEPEMSMACMDDESTSMGSSSSGDGDGDGDGGNDPKNDCKDQNSQVVDCPEQIDMVNVEIEDTPEAIMATITLATEMIDAEPSVTTNWQFRITEANPQPGGPRCTISADAFNGGAFVCSGSQGGTGMAVQFDFSKEGHVCEISADGTRWVFSIAKEDCVVPPERITVVSSFDDGSGILNDQFEIP